MTNLVKRNQHNPRSIFEELFDGDFENLLTFEPRRFGRGLESMKSNAWSPRVDIRETEDALIFDAEMPGIKEEDVEVTVENNVLTVKGERKFEKDEKDENFHRIERCYGSFQRAFSLPNNVDVNDVKANYSNGMLEISFPKKAEAKPKKVKIDLMEK